MNVLFCRDKVRKILEHGVLLFPWVVQSAPRPVTHLKNPVDINEDIEEHPVAIS